MTASLTLDWADGSYDFRLTWVGAAEVERKADAGIQAIYERLMLAGAHLADVSEIIRQGLIGGGSGIVDDQTIEVKAATASALIARYVTGPEGAPFADSWVLAKAILQAFIVGHEGAQKKSAEPDEPAPVESIQQRSSPTAP